MGRARAAASSSAAQTKIAAIGDRRRPRYYVVYQTWCRTASGRRLAVVRPWLSPLIAAVRTTIVSVGDDRRALRPAARRALATLRPADRVSRAPPPPAVSAAAARFYEWARVRPS